MVMGMPSTQELLEKELPATPEKDGHCLVQCALEVSAVPARKQNLKEKMGLKEPAAAIVFKKPAVKKEVAKLGIDKRALDYKHKGFLGGQLCLFPFVFLYL